MIGSKNSDSHYRAGTSGAILRSWPPPMGLQKRQLGFSLSAQYNRHVRRHMCMYPQQEPRRVVCDVEYVCWRRNRKGRRVFILRFRRWTREKGGSYTADRMCRVLFSSTALITQITGILCTRYIIALGITHVSGTQYVHVMPTILHTPQYLVAVRILSLFVACQPRLLILR